MKPRDELPVDQWRQVIAAICRRHRLAGEPRPFETGSDVVWAAGEHVIKLTTPRWREQLANEARWLEWIGGRLPVATPELVAAGEHRPWPYVIMSRVPGRAIAEVWPGLDRDQRLGLAAELGRLTGRLHELEPPPEPDADWERFWKGCRRDVAGRHRGPRHLVDEIEGFVGSLELADSSRVALHTELLDQHVLVGERLEVAGLIDFADARVGPAAYEHAASVEFIFRGEPGLLRAYLLGRGEPAETLSRDRSREMLGWALCHQFGSLERMLAARAPKNPGCLDELATSLYRLD